MCWTGIRSQSQKHDWKAEAVNVRSFFYRKEKRFCEEESSWAETQTDKRWDDCRDWISRWGCDLQEVSREWLVSHSDRRQRRTDKEKVKQWQSLMKAQKTNHTGSLGSSSGSLLTVRIGCFEGLRYWYWRCSRSPGTGPAARPSRPAPDAWPTGQESWNVQKFMSGRRNVTIYSSCFVLHWMWIKEKGKCNFVWVW